MREIRFRAWSKIDNKFMDETSSLMIGLDGRLYLACMECYIEGEYILMQYTGRKDINGKEEYEGDIIYTYSKTRKTIWDKLLVCFGEYSVDCEYYEPSCRGVGFYYRNLKDDEIEEFYLIGEIVGNIYENPELLEVEE